MRFRLRTLVVLTAVVPPLLALIWVAGTSLFLLLVRKGDLEAFPLGAATAFGLLFLCAGTGTLLLPAEKLLARDKEHGPAYYKQELKRSGGDHDRAMARISRNYKITGIVCIAFAIVYVLMAVRIVLHKLSH